jgi:inosine-uridine nucleoside N-ribohydrolase
MGGYVYPTRAGYPAWGNDMDWNVQIDVAASRLVLERANPLLAPLTVTVETALRRVYLPVLQQAGPLGQLLARQAEAHAAEYDNERLLGQTCTSLPDDLINFQHDPLACAIALGWDEGVGITELPLVFEVEDGWLHERVDPRGKPTRVVTQVDGERFSQFWLDTVGPALHSRE